MLTKWKWIWRNQPQNGWYGLANHTPPSFQPTSHFKALHNQREIFGYLVQCRTGYSYFGDYYQFAVSLENIFCPCREEIQTWKHIINICPQYENHCQILCNVSSSVYMPDILGTKQGIASLSKFLKRTGAFTKNKTGLLRWKPSVIRRECGQTLARVRVSRTYISIIIISLQRMESTWPGSHVIEARVV